MYGLGYIECLKDIFLKVLNCQKQTMGTWFV